MNEIELSKSEKLKKCEKNKVEKMGIVELIDN